MIYKSFLIEENIKLLSSNLSLFYGENLGLKNELKVNIRKLNKDSEVINFSQEEILRNNDTFFNEILNISLFEKKKIYFVSQANDKILDLINKIESHLDNQKIFIFSDILDKRSKLRNFFEKSKVYGVVPCYPDNELTIRKIILNKLGDFNGLSAQNINMIIDNSNLNRDKLNNELKKIISYFINKKIESQDLEKLLDNKINEDFNLLKDEVLGGNKSKTNKLLSDTIIDSEKSTLYLSLINQRLSKLAEISELTQKSKIADAINMLKPPVFWKDKPVMMIQAKKWNLNKIKDILNKTYKLEIEIKSNSIVNKNLLMKKLLLDICVLANSS